MNENKSEFEPRIVAFVCNWCTYAGADLTGTSRLKYATNVEIVRFPCTGRIDFMLLLKAFAGVGLSFADYLISWALMFGESVILGYRQPKEPNGQS